MRLFIIYENMKRAVLIKTWPETKELKAKNNKFAVNAVFAKKFRY